MVRRVSVYLSGALFVTAVSYYMLLDSRSFIQMRWRLSKGIAFGEIVVSMDIHLQHTPSEVLFVASNVAPGTIIEPDSSWEPQAAKWDYDQSNDLELRFSLGKTFESVRIRPGSDTIHLRYTVKLPEEYLRPFRDARSEWFVVPIDSCLLVPKDVALREGIISIDDVCLSLVPECREASWISIEQVKGRLLVVGPLPPQVYTRGFITVRSNSPLPSPVQEKLDSHIKGISEFLPVWEEEYEVMTLAVPTPKKPYEYLPVAQKGQCLYLFQGRMTSEDLLFIGHSLVWAYVFPHGFSYVGGDDWLRAALPRALSIMAAPPEVQETALSNVFDRLVLYETDSSLFRDTRDLSLQERAVMADLKGPLFGRKLLLYLDKHIDSRTSLLEGLVRFTRGPEHRFEGSFKGLNATELAEIVKELRALDRWFSKQRSVNKHFYMSAASRGKSNGTERKRLRIVVNKGNDGFLETCGCIASQAGGLARRASVFERLRASSGDVLFLELGEFFPQIEPRLFSPLDLGEGKVQAEALSRMGYHAIVPGSLELHQGPDILRAFKEAASLPLVSSGELSDMGLAASAVLTSGKVAIIGITGYNPAPQHATRTRWCTQQLWDPFPLPPSIRAIEDASSRARAAGARVVLVCGSVLPHTLLKLMSLTTVDVSLSLHGPPCLDIADLWELASGLRLLPAWGIENVKPRNDRLFAVWLPTGERSTDVRVLDLEETEQGYVLGSTEVIPLVESVGEDKGVKALITKFNASLAQDGAIAWHGTPRFAEELVENLPGNSYIGNSSCIPCHAEQHSHWSKTHHATALITLRKRHRDKYPRCVVCHSTGYLRPTGHTIAEGTDLQGVQCEACHGPGLLHSKLPMKQNLIRRALSKEQCAECHTPENSSGFDMSFAEKYERIRH